MAGEILSWESKFGDRSLLEQAVRNPAEDGDSSIPADGIADSPILDAYVNHSRWIAKCPFCPNTEFVSTVRLSFFCCNCRNRQYGNQPLPVNVPSNRTDIEAALLARPDPALRNWYPGETVDDLNAETADLEAAAEAAADAPPMEVDHS